MTRVLLVCPGRGAYGAPELGSLPRYDAVAPAAAARDGLLPLADAFRRDRGLPTVTELDAAPAFDPALHLPGENASVLIYTLSAIEALALAASDLRPVAVCGNSLGWYTALHVSGALPFSDGLRLVQTMGALSGSGETGGQIVYPLAGEDWRPVPGRRAEIDAAIAAVRGEGGFAAWSVDLAGYGVIAGDAAGLARLREILPPVVSGGRTYPIPLPRHSAFHTELVADRAAAARAGLSGLPVANPEIPLIDGRGVQHRPLTADPAATLDYTLGAQVTTTYDLAASLRVGLREYAPDAVVLLGPGESIGGAIGMALVREGWRGIRSKEDFVRVQESDAPVLLSLGRKGVLAAALANPDRGRTGRSR